MHDFNFEISINVQPLFLSRKLEQVLRSKEVRPSIISEQFLVCSFCMFFARRIMVATQPDIFINAFPNSRTQLLVKAIWRPVGAYFN